jgi:hypothetical protein
LNPIALLVHELALIIMQRSKSDSDFGFFRFCNICI